MPGRDSKLARELVWVYALATIALAGIILLAPAHPPHNLALGILGTLALIAEFLPVQVNRDGLRITLSLPFIAGIAVISGPLWAIGADATITIAAAAIIAWNRREPLAWKWLGANLAVSVIACGTAGMVMTNLEVFEPKGTDVLQDLAFVVVYTVVNFLLITRLNSIVTGRSFSDNVVQGLRVSVVGLGLYCLVSLGVSVLLTDAYYLWLPAMIIPVLALRHGLAMKARIYENYYETVAALSMMMQRTNPTTHYHLERVAELAQEVALRLGLPAKRARLVRAAALLHDIGKIAIDEQILDKPARLTEMEMEHVRLHSEYGAVILDQCEQFRPMVPWVRSHHERPDGAGYPNRLQDIEIPIESKIISVVDAFDAMVGGEEGERSYRPKMDPEEALAELRRCAGTQFDRDVVEAFVVVARSSGVAA
ncbi:MAG: HD-GYP domain-containing protein [Fimbriimonadaceae bacterium]|nr:HD-GYP domain-containing protein [Fimbriimonadaceae bacterium]